MFVAGRAEAEPGYERSNRDDRRLAAKIRGSRTMNAGCISPNVNQAQKHAGSDNRCSRDYAIGVVNRICAECSAPFMVRARRLLHGRGICCSRSCASRRAGRAGSAAQRALYPQKGDGNFNFKGWRSHQPSVYTKRFKTHNPEKVSAQRAVASALRSRRLVRPSACSKCNVPCRVDGHHDDYGQPLAVRWLCRRCHRQADLARKTNDCEGSRQASSSTREAV